MSSSHPSQTKFIMTKKDDGEQQQEERWIEAKDYNNNANSSSKKEEEEEEEDGDDVFDMSSLFADPDPMDVFVTTFQVSNENKILNKLSSSSSSFDPNSNKEDDNEGRKNLPSALKDTPPLKEEITITLQGVKSENGQIINSTGLTLWNASYLLCNFLANNKSLIQGKSVIELGAGLGQCGTLAHKLNAKFVLMTDGDTDVLQQLRNNVKSNIDHSHFIYNSRDGMTRGNKSSEKESGVVAVSQLVWGRNISEFKRKWCPLLSPPLLLLQNNGNNNNNSSSSSINHDYKEDENDSNGFDIIMGSDIIYMEEILDALFDTVVDLMILPSSSSPETTRRESLFLLAYARRNVSIDLVLECATRHGLCWITEHQIKDNDDDDDGRSGGGAAAAKEEGVFIFRRKRNKEV